MTILTGHHTPETAHLSFAYPYGRSRCIRREYIESHPRTRHQRFNTQTTHPSFNAIYTAKLESDGPYAANAWAKTEIDAGRVRWNAPNRSTYSLGMLMGEKELGDGSGRLGVYPITLWQLTSPDTATLALADAHDRLDSRTIAILEKIVAINEQRETATATA